MWAVALVGALFLVACGCVTTALYRHDGPMWAAVFVALIVAAVVIF
jgi:hypothetical protein